MGLVLKGYWVEKTPAGSVRESLPWTFELDPEVVARHISDSCAFIHYYDQAAVAQDNRIAPLDWGVTSLLMGPVRTDDTFSVLAAQPNGRSGCPAAISAGLSRVPPSAKLTAADARESYGDGLSDLLAAICQVKGVGPSIATKLLHKKRPDLIPVVDSLVFEFYTGTRMPQSKSLAVGPVIDLILGRFRNDLISNSSEGQFLGGVRTRLLEDSIDFLTDVRVLEMSIWLACRRPSGFGLSKPSGIAESA